MDTVYTVRVTDEARANIDVLFAGLRDMAGEQPARLWRDGLLSAIGTLATLPGRCPAAPESRSFLNSSVRQLLYQRRRGGPTYRVLFTTHAPADDAPFVRVQHIRHGAQRPLTAEDVQAWETD